MLFLYARDFFEMGLLKLVGIFDVNYGHVACQISPSGPLFDTFCRHQRATQQVKHKDLTSRHARLTVETFHYIMRKTPPQQPRNSPHTPPTPGHDRQHVQADTLPHSHTKRDSMRIISTENKRRDSTSLSPLKYTTTRKFNIESECKPLEIVHV